MSELESEQLESQVVENFQLILTEYRRMDHLADRMLNLQAQGKTIETEMQSLHQNREALERIQAQAKPMQQAYRISQANASESVKQLSQVTTSLIQSLIKKVAMLEESTRESYRRLTPEIDQNVRGNQMKSAYGNLMP